MSYQRFVPKQSTRGTTEYVFFELALALGPEAIGVTGDNSYETLYGREYLLVWDDDDGLVKLFRETATRGVWDRITEGLPTAIFDIPLPATARHLTFAFDQSARIIFAYEDGGEILVTRWDATSNQYVQNVTFTGVDPCLLMDATVADPRGFPNVTDDGWSVREAYFAGIRVLYEWIPDATFRDTPIPDSDIVLFYLTPDRLEVKARVQRQLYATVNDIHTFAEPVVMDRAVALSGKYQLLVSDAAGDQLANMLISDAYLGEFIITPEPANVLLAGTPPEDFRVDALVLPKLAADGLVGATNAEDVRVDTLVYLELADDGLDASVLAEGLRVDQLVYADTVADALDASVVTEGVRVEEVVVPVAGEEGLNGTVYAEAIRVQAT